MKLPTTKSASSKLLSRRRFIAATAAQLTCLSYAGKVLGQVTGAENPKLAAFDEVMNQFMIDHKPPGAALAVAFHGRLVYARGFGHADLEKQTPVKPDSRFRIASLSKAITSAAIMRLVDQGKMSLDVPVLSILRIQPFFERGASFDPRWQLVTINQCLHHIGGWDRDATFDPMGPETAEKVAQALNVPLPIVSQQIIRYMLGRPLDYYPGTKFVYSNFGYCLLGRVVEAVSGQPFDQFVLREILAPAGVRHMQLAKDLLHDRAPGEVKYYDTKKRTGRAVTGPNIGKQVPVPYGASCLESIDANGGWIASTIDLLRFASALDDPMHSPILKPASVVATMAPPPGPLGLEANGKVKDTFYACGWGVHPFKDGTFNKWHMGLIAGSSTLLVCRRDRLDWAVFFNTDSDQEGHELANVIDSLLHKPANETKDWPDIDLFQTYS